MKKLLLPLLLGLWSLGAGAAELSDENGKLQFLQQFAHYASWPAESDRKAGAAGFNLCLLGSTDRFDTSLKLLSGKTLQLFAGGQAHEWTVQPARLLSLARIRQCHLLFVTESSPYGVVQVMQELQHAAVLVISESGPLEETMILLFRQGSRLWFDINQARIRAAGLDISAQVLNLARYKVLAK